MKKAFTEHSQTLQVRLSHSIPLTRKEEDVNVGLEVTAYNDSRRSFLVTFVEFLDAFRMQQVQQNLFLGCPPAGTLRHLILASHMSQLRLRVCVPGLLGFCES